MTTHSFEVYFDGACPLCTKEINVLRKLDRKGKILFTDIANPEFDASQVGISWDGLMDRIHGRMADGTLVEGMEVFRQLYGAVGFGPLVLLTRIPGISQLLNLAYHLFAKNRLKLTGRCKEGVCALHPSSNGGKSS